MSVRELRPEIFKNCDILEAMLALNYSLSEENKSQLERVF
jgi:hypothetical protein